MASVLERPGHERDVTPEVPCFELKPALGNGGIRIMRAFVVDDRTTPEATSSFTSLMPSFELSAYKDILHQIADLSSGDETDEYGVLRPTDHALAETRKVLESAVREKLGEGARDRKASLFPRGCVTTDEEGGLRIEWWSEDRAVHLVVPAARGGRSYIYHELGEAYKTEDRVTGTVLAHWLQRLFG